MNEHIITDIINLPVNNDPAVFAGTMRTDLFLCVVDLCDGFMIIGLTHFD